MKVEGGLRMFAWYTVVKHELKRQKGHVYGLQTFLATLTASCATCMVMKFCMDYI